MSTQRLLLKNLTYQSASQLLSALVGIAVAFTLSRQLGVEGYGELNYIFTFTFMFLMLSDFGIGTILVRELSQHPGDGDRLMSAALSLKLALSVFFMVAVWLAIPWLSLSSSLSQALAIYMVILPIQTLGTSKLYFIASLKLGYLSWIHALHRLAVLFVVILMCWMGLHLRSIVIGFVLTEIIDMILIRAYSSRWIKSSLCFDPELWTKFLKAGFPLGMAALFVSIINRIDFVMLEKMAGSRELGFYSASYKITDLYNLIPAFMMSTIYPLMSRCAKEDPGRLKRIFLKSTVLLSIAAIPLGVATVGFSDVIIRAIFGVNFISAAATLRVLIWSTVFLYMAITAGNLLVSIGRTGFSLIVVAMGAVLNIFLNVLLIPMYASMGAALATSAAYFFLFATNFGGSCWFLYGKRNAIAS